MRAGIKGSRRARALRAIRPLKGLLAVRGLAVVAAAMLALFEHRALILADSGIHRKVEEDEWQALVTALVDGIRAERTVDALVETIGRCGDLLEERGVARRADDVDELANAPRLKER